MNHITRAATIIGAVALTTTAFAGTAAAHTPSVIPSCTGLAISLTNYEGYPPANNRVTIHIVNSDGSQYDAVSDFATTYYSTPTWSPFLSHDWTVTIDANRFNGDPTRYDVVAKGTQQACQTAPTTTTVAPTTTVVAPTTTAVEATTTSVPSQVTTTVVAVGEPPVPTTTAPPAVADDQPASAVADEPVLPRTGANYTVELILGFALVVGGTLVMRLRRQ